jgi:6-phosphogluconolactonase (cycloisomerase 2 family)
VVPKCLVFVAAVVLFMSPQAAYTCPITGGCVYPVGVQNQAPSASSPNPNGYVIISEFFSGATPTHAGVDLANGSSGGEVRSIATGQVVQVLEGTTGFGWAVRIAHQLTDGSTVYSIYGHMLANSITVSEGDIVTKGQTIGQVDHTGVSTGPHLHFAIRKIDNFACGYVPSKFKQIPMCATDTPSNYLDPLQFVSSAIETIYTANHDSNDISAFQVDAATGTLRAISGSPYSGDGATKWLIAIDPSHSVLYTLGDHTLFALDPASGALSSTGVVNDVLGSPEQMVIHPSGNFVYASTQSVISGFSRNAADGSLAAFSNSSVSVHPSSASAITIDPAGRFLFVMQDVVFVSVYAIDATTGALSEVSGSPFQTGVGDQRSLVIHPSGKFLYVMGGNLDASVPVQSALLVDTTTGSLTPIGQQHEGRLLEAEVIDPSGRFLYGTDPVTNEIIGFQIDTTSGQLIPMFSLPVPFQINNLLGSLVTQKLSIDRSGAFLYVLAPQANSIYGYSVGSSGVLTPLAASPFPTGLRPVGIAAR